MLQKIMSDRANKPFFQLTRPFPARLPPSPDATLVTYGGLAKKPVLLGAGSFIFRGLTATGFWLSSPGRAADRVPGLEEAADLLARGVLKTECAREEGGGRRGGGGGTARGQRRPPPTPSPASNASRSPTGAPRSTACALAGRARSSRCWCRRERERDGAHTPRGRPWLDMPPRSRPPAHDATAAW